MNVKKNRLLTTSRLLLKPISEEHKTTHYLNWLNDEDVYKYLETRGNYTIEMLDSFIKEQISKNVYMWGIHIKDTDKHIGNIKIDPINLKHQFGEYGILVGDKEEWGKGYAREASEVVIRYFFDEELLLRKINLGVVSSNTAAINLYKNIGFQIEGTLKKHVIYDGVYHDIIRMAIFNPQYNYDF